MLSSGFSVDRVPAADIDVGVDLVQRLLTEQHPDLASLAIEIAAEGWDRVVFRLGTDLALRVLRRSEAAALVLQEQQVLIRLTERLTISVRGVPLAERYGEVIPERLASGLLDEPDDLAAVWKDALSAPVHTGPAVRIHGDLHPANLIVRDGALSAVIDFGDTTTGDPATDLAVAWLGLGSIGRNALLADLAPGPPSTFQSHGASATEGASRS